MIKHEHMSKYRRSLSILMTVVMVGASTLGFSDEVYGAKLSRKNLDVKIDSESILDTLLSTNGKGLDLDIDEDDVYENIKNELDNGNEQLVGRLDYENLKLFLITESDDIGELEETSYIKGVINPISLYKGDVQINNKDDYSGSDIILENDLLEDDEEDENYEIYMMNKMEIASSISNLHLIVVNTSINVEYALDVEIDDIYKISDDIQVSTLNIDNYESKNDTIEIDREDKGDKSIDLGSSSNAIKKVDEEDNIVADENNIGTVEDIIETSENSIDEESNKEENNKDVSMSIHDINSVTSSVIKATSNNSTKKSSPSNASSSNATKKDNIIKVTSKPNSIINIDIPVEFGLGANIAFEIENRLIIHTDISVDGFGNKIIPIMNGEINTDDLEAFYTIKINSSDTSKQSYKCIVVDENEEYIDEYNVDGACVSPLVKNGYTLIIYDVPSNCTVSVKEYLNGNNKLNSLFDIDYSKSSYQFMDLDVENNWHNNWGGLDFSKELDYSTLENSDILLNTNMHLKLVRDGSINLRKNIGTYDNIYNKHNVMFMYTVEKLDEPAKGMKFTVPIMIYGGGSSNSVDIGGLYPGTYEITEEDVMRYTNFIIESDKEIERINDKKFRIQVLNDSNYVELHGGMSTNEFFSNVNLSVNSIYQLDNNYEFVRNILNDSDEPVPCRLEVYGFSESSFLPNEKFELDISDIDELRLA